jgi:hypothetical protein
VHQGRVRGISPGRVGQRRDQRASVLDDLRGEARQPPDLRVAVGQAEILEKHHNVVVGIGPCRPARAEQDDPLKAVAIESGYGGAEARQDRISDTCREIILPQSGKQEKAQADDGPRVAHPALHPLPETQTYPSKTASLMAASSFFASVFSPKKEPLDEIGLRDRPSGGLADARDRGAQPGEVGRGQAVTLGLGAGDRIRPHQG